MKRASKILCAAAMVLAFTGEARAASISLASGTTTDFDILWEGIVYGNDVSVLGEFTVTVTDSYADFLITVTNNTDPASEMVHSIGFNTDPNATGLINEVAGTYFKNFDLSKNIAGGYDVDVCAWGTQNCTGGGQNSNLPGGGATDTFGFRLVGDFSDGLVLSTFVVKIQGDPDSYHLEGEQPPTVVPEPSALLLLGLGFISAVGARRKG